jgi:glutamate/tyrosine decarboxylase-like PLP-dependent enzyme
VAQSIRFDFLSTGAEKLARDFKSTGDNAAAAARGAAVLQKAIADLGQKENRTAAESKLLASALNVNGMLWRTSPAATELEQRTLAWVLELLGLPEGWFGEITDTASTSTMYALAAAREAAGLDIRQRGMAGRSDLPPLRVYSSAEAHSSVDKACIALGLGLDGLTKIDTDAELRMRPGTYGSRWHAP